MVAKEEGKRGPLGPLAALGVFLFGEFLWGVSLLRGGAGCTVLRPPFCGIVSFLPGPRGKLEKSLSEEPLPPHHHPQDPGPEEPCQGPALSQVHTDQA